MADFSKQWCEINDPQMPSDFDIIEEFNNLSSGEYITAICEGFGFIAISKQDDKCYLAMPNGDSTNRITWTPYEDVIK